MPCFINDCRVSSMTSSSRTRASLLPVVTSKAILSSFNPDNAALSCAYAVVTKTANAAPVAMDKILDMVSLPWRYFTRHFAYVRHDAPRTWPFQVPQLLVATNLDQNISEGNTMASQGGGASGTS